MRYGPKTQQMADDSKQESSTNVHTSNTIPVSYPKEFEVVFDTPLDMVFNHTIDLLQELYKELDEYFQNDNVVGVEKFLEMHITEPWLKNMPQEHHLNVKNLMKGLLKNTKNDFLRIFVQHLNDNTDESHT